MISEENRVQEASDNALMLAFGSGDAEAFDLLYQRHKLALYRFLYFRTCGSKPAADELYQEVWHTVIRLRHKFMPNMVFRDWLYHLVWSRAADFRHTSIASTSGVATAEKRSQTAPSTQRSATSVCQAFDELPRWGQAARCRSLEAVNTLEPVQRDVVQLKYCLDMEISEIAEFLNLTRDHIRRSHNAATQKLRSALRRVS